MKQVISLLFACICCSALLAQECGVDRAHKKQLQDSNYVRALGRTEQNIRNYITSHPIKRGNNINSIKIVPVVVHIMNPGVAIGDPSGYNPTDQQVIDAINFLNGVYDGTTPGMVQSLPTNYAAGNMEIRFELAKRTPLNSPTTGIDRVDATCLSDYVQNGVRLVDDISAVGCNEKDLKNLAKWDPLSYLNIWLVNKIEGFHYYSPPGTKGTDGFGYFPDLHPELAGVVVLSEGIGITTSNDHDRERKTLAHEIGHYFDLYHTFQGGGIDSCPPQTSNSCDSSGDMVCDTDPVTNHPISQTNYINPCTGTIYKINTEWNVMAYTESRTLFTLKQKERFVAALNHPLRIFLFNSSNMALVPPTPNQYFNTCTNPIFKTNDFTCISVGKDGSVWAGTYQRGLYKLNGTTSVWERATVLDSNAINDIKADKNGGIWIAQSGRGADVAFDGGIEYFPNASFTPQQHYGGTISRPARYILSLFSDTTRFNPGNLPVIWSANLYNSTGGAYTSGGLGKGLNSATPGFDLIRQGLETTYNFGNLRSIGGNAAEIWTYSFNNFNKSQLLVYDPSGSLVNTYDYLNQVSANYLDAHFTAKSIYFDKFNNRWIGMLIGGLVVVDSNNTWHTISSSSGNFSSIFPTNMHVNSNAITGDKFGNVFIGTDSGLVIYNGGPIDLACSYKRYTTADGLTHNNVKGICVDTLRRKLLLATEEGINFWSPINTTGSSAQPFVTTANGDIINPSTWCGGAVPPPNSDVFVKHAITITTNVTLNSLKVENGGSVNVLSGVHLTLTNQH